MTLKPMIRGQYMKSAATCPAAQEITYYLTTLGGEGEVTQLCLNTNINMRQEIRGMQ